MAGKREKKREDPMAVWLSTMCRLLKGGALAAATAALGLLVCALLVSGGVVGEKLMGRGVLAICVVSSLAGGLLAVRRLERGTLLAGLGVGVILFLLLLTAGFLRGGVPVQRRGAYSGCMLLRRGHCRSAGRTAQEKTEKID